MLLWNSKHLGVGRRKKLKKRMKKIMEHEGCNVNTIDEQQRTAIFFVGSLGSGKRVRFLVKEAQIFTGNIKTVNQQFRSWATECIQT
jgi:hypothetical protein